ncbi:MAG: DUF4132 domain-containing protein [Rhizobiales bacterium]|nr:DUF4132 domain-containing protein [Hyphomicrobiales bacterium]
MTFLICWSLLGDRPGHPLVGRLAARLVWDGLGAEGQSLALFRPLGDGSYTDPEDNDVALAEFTTVRLAHSSLLEAAAIAKWRQHLADYAVEAPFDQLGRDLPVRRCRPRQGDRDQGPRRLDDRKLQAARRGDQVRLSARPGRGWRVVPHL